MVLNRRTGEWLAILLEINEEAHSTGRYRPAEEAEKMLLVRPAFARGVGWAVVGSCPTGLQQRAATEMPLSAPAGVRTAALACTLLCWSLPF